MKRFLFIFLTIALTNHANPTLLSAQENTLGRPYTNGVTLLTDKGTLLRGCYISTDFSGILPEREFVTNIKQRGLNAIHMYPECEERREVGELVHLVDTLVQWTMEDSLYLVITIGCCNANGSHVYNFAMDFWDFYAPRYKDYAHVIYEIHNEPGYDDRPQTLKMNYDAYRIIRQHAPETHVLFFSYADPKNGEDVISDVATLSDSVDWSNASVGFHGYGSMAGSDGSFFDVLREQNIPATCTEFGFWDVSEANFKLTKLFEEKGISYLHFLTTEAIADDEKFKDPVEELALYWEADFGNWPPEGMVAEPTAASSQIEAELFDHVSGEIGAWSFFVGMINNNDAIHFDNIEFDESLTHFIARISSPNGNASINVYRDSIGGELLGSCPVPRTGSWDSYTEVSCEIIAQSGVHDLVLQFKGPGFDFMNIDWFTFSTNGLTAVREVSGDNNIRIIRLDQYSIDFEITTKQSGMYLLEIYDLNGRKIVLNKLDINEMTTVHAVRNLNLAKGMYVFKLQSGNTVFMDKFLIR